MNTNPITTDISAPNSADTDATLLATWRAHLQLALHKPWLATPWLARSRALLARFTRIYDHLCCQPRHVRHRLQRQLGASLAGAALALALANSPVQALPPEPDPANAQINGSDCDLIDAIIAANTDTATGDCAAGTPGADTIILLHDVTLTTINNYNAFNGGGANGLPVVTSTITIEGAGATITRSSADRFRILRVQDSGNLTLNNTTISGGSTPYQSGGLYNNSGSTLTINNSTISGNSADSNAGGIFNRGTLTINNSTISGNSAGSGNSGGGIYTSGIATISNSTVSGNSANGGGGLFNTGTLTLERSLISGNSASTGNEIFNYVYIGCLTAATVTSPSCLVSVNEITTDTLNLFGHSGESNAQAFTNFTPGASDITATSNGTTPTALASILDPTLADNGGNTLTHALVSGSPAIDTAGDSGLTIDQRGVARPQGTADDIGAVEAKSLNGSSGSVSQTGVTAAYNATPQSCPATGSNLPFHTITPTLLNNSDQTFTDLFFRVKTLEYKTDQGGLAPSLCNATSVVANGGVGSMLAIANSSLPGGNDAYDPAENIAPTFLVGLPVRAAFRINVDLFSSTASAAGTATTIERYIGNFDLVIDPTTEEPTAMQTVFLPIVTSQP